MKIGDKHTNPPLVVPATTQITHAQQKRSDSMLRVGHACYPEWEEASSSTMETRSNSRAGGACMELTAALADKGAAAHE